MALAAPVSCNLCKADDFVNVYPAGLAQVNQIVLCKSCGLMYANPRIVSDYRKDSNEESSFDMATENPQRYEKEVIQVRDYANIRALLSRLYPQRGKLIEIGSSMGYQLDAFRKEGWEVLGIDPYPPACRHARKQFDLPVFACTLEEANLPCASADVVVMLHVIEHLPDPIATLHEIYGILKVGGHLVLETPRYGSLMHKLLGYRERSLGCDGHIYFYTTETLRKTYERVGFELVQFEYVGRTLTLDRLAYNLGVISKSMLIKQRISGHSRWLGLHKHKITLNVRDMQRVCVKKVA